MNVLPTYFKQLSSCFAKIESEYGARQRVPLVNAVGKVVRRIVEAAQRGNKIMVIGNGGSAAIASHMAIDLLKNACVPAMVFNDASSLTCFGNDLGYDAVFSKPIATLSKKGDILVAISSSGQSSNILKAVEAAEKRHNFLVTLSGFSSSNPLRKMGDVNFYVPSSSYGFVEIAHSIICHWISDWFMDPGAHG